MKIKNTLLVTSILLIAFTVVVILLAIILFRTQNPPDVYCLMVTGKDNDRINYARLAVQNFLSQSYKHKTLIIINQHPSQKVLLKNDNLNIKEIQVKKTQDITLGDLRNISLTHVPNNAYWTTWDDDDWRAPEYIQFLMAYITNSIFPSKTIVAYTRRLEYNLNNGASWVAAKKSGFVTIMAKKHPNIKYIQRDSMEDTSLLGDYEVEGFNVRIIQNSPTIYLRLVHTNNTSLYVKKDKNYLITGEEYWEYATNNVEKQFINQILEKYYGLKMAL